MKYILSAFADEAAQTIEGQIDALVRNNIEYIELRNINSKPVLDHTAEELFEIKKKLDFHDIKVSALGSPIGKIKITDDFAPHVELFKKALVAAEIFCTKKIRMFSFFVDNHDCKPEVFERLNTFYELSKKTNITCCHENEKGIYGDTKEFCLEILKEFDGKILGIFDFANFIQCGDIPDVIFDEMMLYIDYFHIKDALLADGTVVPPGHGDGNIKKILSRYSSPKETTILTLEPHLTVFDGLKNLQDEELKHKYSFASQGEAFDFAVAETKKILEEIGNE